MIGIASVWNPKKPDYWFSKYNRVLLHYSVSINAAAETVAYIPLSSTTMAVYIPQSAAAAHIPRSASFRLFSRYTTVSYADVIENTLRVLHNTSNN